MIIRQIKLTDSQRIELEEGYRNGNTASFRQRCHIILLKSQSRKAKDITQITGLNIQSIYNWLNRYEEKGIQGLQTKAGQGRPKILDEQHEQIIKDCITKERQRLSLVMDEIQHQTGKQFSQMTLKRFLKTLATPTNVFVKE